MEIILSMEVAMEVEWFIALKGAENDALALQILQGMEKGELEASDGVLGHMGALGEALQVVLWRGFVASAEFLFEKSPSACHHLLVCSCSWFHCSDSYRPVEQRRTK